MVNDIILPKVEFLTQVFYLYYDDNGNITDLVNYKKDTGNYIEVSEDFVIEFRSNSKSITSYNIKVGNNVKLEKKQVERNLGVYLVIPELNETTEVEILVKDNYIKFRLSNVQVYKTFNLNQMYNMYIVDSYNLNFVKETIKIMHEQLVEGYVYPYNFDKEKELIVTKKYFDSYGIKYE